MAAVGQQMDGARVGTCELGREEGTSHISPLSSG